MQVSLEADLGSEPGYISVRGVHVVPGYCHPLPPKATKGAVLLSLGNVLTNPDVFEIAFFFLLESAFCPQETTESAYRNRATESGACPVQTNPSIKVCGFIYVKIRVEDPR